MADQYLTIAIIAHDVHMSQRVTACAAQQGITNNPQGWAVNNAFTWAASPGWAEKWDSAVASSIEEPGADSAVITDGDILATVQGMLS